MTTLLHIATGFICGALTVITLSAVIIATDDIITHVQKNKEV